MSKQREVSGDFVDHETGQSRSYVARFRRVAGDVLWSARVKLQGRWVELPEGRLRRAGIDQNDFVISELVRDSVIDSVYDAEPTQAPARPRKGTAHYALYAIAVIGIALLAYAIWLRRN